MSVIQDSLKTYFSRHPLPQKATIGVAVSGGADSLCLALNLAQYAQKNGLSLKAATVDHGLRPESGTEARYVHNLMTKMKVMHTTLLWTGKKPKTRLEERARQKRYELLEDWCKKNGIEYLFLAHHLGDQAETFWTRLARGSGLTGLSAMGEYSKLNDIILCRPFLNLPKIKLEQDLSHHKIKWCEDAMNADEAYERVRWRHRQRTLSEWGLLPEKVGLSCRRLSRAKDALDFYTIRFYNALADLSPMGYFTVQEQAFASIPDEIKLRVIIKILNHLNPDKVSAPLDALERWLWDYPKSATLGGCVLVRSRGILFIARESRHLKKSVLLKPLIPTQWNGFWILSACPAKIELGIKDKNLPFCVRGTVPSVSERDNLSLTFMTGTKKELEKKFNLHYKDKKSEVILLSFKGKK